MKIDPIGIWCGENISEMSRERLLEFAAWAAKRIEGLQKIEQETQEYRIEKEIGHPKRKFTGLERFLFERT